MTTRSSRLMQDRNINGFTVMEKADTIKGQTKTRTGGRKPLGDLSNAEKISGRQVVKQSSSGNYSFIKEETAAAKLTKDLSRNRIVKASGEKQTVGRKALSDISNSGKAHGLGTTKKHSLKLDVMKEEESCHLEAVVEEQFLHNHQDCIKAKSKPMDMGLFLEAVGLEKDMFSRGASSSASVTSNELQSENSLKHLEMKEMEEQLHEIPHSRALLESPLPCNTMKSPISMWKGCDINFKLMETPNALKY